MYIFHKESDDFAASGGPEGGLDVCCGSGSEAFQTSAMMWGQSWGRHGKVCVYFFVLP